MWLLSSVDLILTRRYKRSLSLAKDKTLYRLFISVLNSLDNLRKVFGLCFAFTFLFILLLVS